MSANCKIICMASGEGGHRWRITYWKWYDILPRWRNVYLAQRVTSTRQGFRLQGQWACMHDHISKLPTWSKHYCQASQATNQIVSTTITKCNHEFQTTYCTTWLSICQEDTHQVTISSEVLAGSNRIIAVMLWGYVTLVYIRAQEKLTIAWFCYWIGSGYPASFLNSNIA